MFFQTLILLIIKVLWIVSKENNKNTKKGAKKSSQLLEIIHTNICEPFDVPTFGGENYFITFIDDY